MINTDSGWSLSLALVLSMTTAVLMYLAARKLPLGFRTPVVLGASTILIQASLFLWDLMQGPASDAASDGRRTSLLMLYVGLCWVSAKLIRMPVRITEAAEGVSREVVQKVLDEVIADSLDED